MVQYRGGILPLVSLGAMLDLKGAPESADAEWLGDRDTLPVVVHERGGRSVGLVVDSIVEIVEEEQRPQSSRGRYAKDAGVSTLVQKVMGTVDTNKCVKAHVAEAELIDKLAMHIRHHATTKGGLRLRTQHLPDGWLRAWVERVKGAGK